MLGNGSVAAQGGTKLIEAYSANDRPPDFYSVVSAHDTPACESILASLNKEYRIKDETLDTNPRASVEADLLLSSDIQIPWERKLVQQPDGGGDDLTSLDFAQVHLGSRTLSMIRRGFTKFVPEVGARLEISRLWLSSALRLSLPSDRPLAVDEVPLAGASEAQLDAKVLKSMDDGPDILLKFGEAPAGSNLFNVVSVRGDLYLLVVDAIQAGTAVQRTLEGVVDLFVLRLASEDQVRTVCHFRSK
ncbi:hypothetical protein SSBR45G_19930 [Bradyrhizobium sp. SSBR45G]|nr:hypothetical protein SSBR45G_19930 [Bradyrhizobium sp. SSBR45G]GLH83843.1 hypothetical protein SSBR45R_13030 [Bradyrhizobium sp. SSBR45R]